MFYYVFIVKKLLNLFDNMDSAIRLNTTLEDFRTKERSVNFNKEEVHRLQVLVNKYKNILVCKKSDNTSTKQKDQAWHCIEKEFNAIGETHRSIKQLKYKFENMKRCAKKEASKERQEIRHTGEGKPSSHPPEVEDSKEWLRSFTSGSMDRKEAVYDDEVIVPDLNIPNTIVEDVPYPDENLIKQENPEENEIRPITIQSEEKIEENESNFDSSIPHSSLRKSIAAPLRRTIKKKRRATNSCIIKNALREKKLSVDLHELELERMRQIVIQEKELHEQLIKYNAEKQKLELSKLHLEIEILKIKKDYENKKNNFYISYFYFFLTNTLM